jgi:RimJ/RimL family protein N-acetyltransferase
MSDLKYLFIFSHVDFDLVEVKREGLSENVPKNKVFKWLVIHKKSSKVLELDFKSMGSHQRSFLEGELKFDDNQGEFIFLGHYLELKRIEREAVSPETQKAIHDYFYQSQLLRAEEDYYFRHLKPSDINYFQHWLFDREVIRYSQSRFHQMTSVDEVKEWLYQVLCDPKSFSLGIVCPQSDALIGYAGLAGLNKVDRCAEFFIFIGHKQYWNRGIGSMVTKQILRIGFNELKLHRIFLTASSKNTAGIKVYEKAGFIYEGKMREAFFREGEYSDKMVMGILSNEYDKG